MRRRRDRASFDPALAAIRERLPGVIVGGSYGRGERACGDLDLLHVGSADEVHAAVVAAGRVVRRGDRYTSGAVRGVPVQVWWCGPDELAAATLYVEGPAARNARLRARARQLGWTLEFGRIVAPDGAPRAMSRDEILEMLL